MAVMHLDEDALFAPEVLDEEGLVLVDFWASWCGPCMMMAPVVEELAEAYPNIKVVKANADAMPKAVQQAGISSIPCFILYENGKEKKRTVGSMPLELLVQELDIF